MNTIIEKAKDLRKYLHTIPELSLKETKTKKALMDFLKENTELRVIDCGLWFYAVKKASNQNSCPERIIGIRADFDAVEGADGLPGHYCGHDGHSASLAGFALLLEQMEIPNEVYLIFQPAEERGEGGEMCSCLIEEKGIQEIYAYHNIPGYAMGEILLLDHTFACASTGLSLTFTGSPSHAAYPEKGKNPALTISELILFTDERLKKPSKGMILSTVIGIELGSDAYGVSASEGGLRLTVRGEYQEEFLSLLEDILRKAEELAKEYELEFSYEEKEPFPATENDAKSVSFIEECAEKAGLSVRHLEEANRWSEDFGYYLQKTKGAMFGVGAGEVTPALHTADYEYPDEIMGDILSLYEKIVNAKNI
ncbi:MAG: M20/M25/M40 family metallo-hydrolase [Eubacteriales bacterium]|nr:M20/M25/M40 family metallo-hydrolase [Eubacteriales bacterium]